MAYATSATTACACTTRKPAAASPIVFVHEFGGDHRSWEPQMRCVLARATAASPTPRAAIRRRTCPPASRRTRRRCAVRRHRRGDGRRGRRSRARRRAVDGRLRHAALRPRASPTARCRSSSPAPATARRSSSRRTSATSRWRSRSSSRRRAARQFAKTYSLGASRVQFQNKDPRGWQEFATWLGEHSSVGAANTMRGVQARRPSIYDLEDRLQA